jgi:hypothetical protein
LDRPEARKELPVPGLGKLMLVGKVGEDRQLEVKLNVEMVDTLLNLVRTNSKRRKIEVSRITEVGKPELQVPAGEEDRQLSMESREMELNRPKVRKEGVYNTKGLGA